MPAFHRERMDAAVGVMTDETQLALEPWRPGATVDVYHWITDSEFLNAVALGQVTPGPVVATVAAVGYAAHGVGGERGHPERARA